MHLELWQDSVMWSLNVGGEFPLLQLFTHMLTSLTVLHTQKLHCHGRSGSDLNTDLFTPINCTSYKWNNISFCTRICAWSSNGWLVPEGNEWDLGHQGRGWRDMAEQKEGHWDGRRTLRWKCGSGSGPESLLRVCLSPTSTGEIQRDKAGPRSGSKVKTESSQAVLPHLHYTLLNTKPLKNIIHFFRIILVYILFAISEESKFLAKFTLVLQKLYKEKGGISTILWELWLCFLSALDKSHRALQYSYASQIC